MRCGFLPRASTCLKQALGGMGKSQTPLLPPWRGHRAVPKVASYHTEHQLGTVGFCVLHCSQRLAAWVFQHPDCSQQSSEPQVDQLPAQLLILRPEETRNSRITLPPSKHRLLAFGRCEFLSLLPSDTCKEPLTHLISVMTLNSHSICRGSPKTPGSPFSPISFSDTSSQCMLVEGSKWDH